MEESDITHAIIKFKNLKDLPLKLFLASINDREYDKLDVLSKLKMNVSEMEFFHLKLSRSLQNFPTMDPIMLDSKLDLT